MKYVADVRHVKEVSLSGSIDVSAWSDDLHAEALAMLAQLNGHPEKDAIAKDLESARGNQVRLGRAIEYIRGELLKAQTKSVA